MLGLKVLFTFAIFTHYIYSYFVFWKQFEQFVSNENTTFEKLNLSIILAFVGSIFYTLFIFGLLFLTWKQ